MCKMLVKQLEEVLVQERARYEVKKQLVAHQSRAVEEVDEDKDEDEDEEDELVGSSGLSVRVRGKCPAK